MKKKLREEALAKRNNIPAELRMEKSRIITEYILQSDAYKQAKIVFSFVSMGSEVETREILRQAWKDGKTVAVPKTEKGRKMIFLRIDSFADLKEGRFGVMEPATGEEVVPEIEDLFLVPGALFDRKKNRYQEPYGWSIGVMDTPENAFGSDRVTSAYTENPEKSFTDILSHLQNVCPGIDMEALQRIIRR